MKTKRWEVIVSRQKDDTGADTYTETKATKREAESRRDALRAGGRKATIRKQK